MLNGVVSTVTPGPMVEHKVALRTYLPLATAGLALITAVIKAKPAVAKGKYVRSATLCSTMSPSVSVDTTPFSVKAAV